MGILQLPYLNIQTTNAKTGRHSKRPPLTIKQHAPDLQIYQQHVDLIHISHRAAKLYIDQQQAFAESNLQTPLRLTGEIVAEAKRKYMDHLAKRRQQGDQMMKIENGRGGKVLSHLAKVNSESPPKQLVTVNMPRSAFSIKFHYEPGELTFSVPSNTIDIHVTRREPEITIPRWETKAYVKQKESIRFQAVGVSVNKEL